MDSELAKSLDYCMHFSYIYSTAFYTVQSTYIHVTNN